MLECDVGGFSSSAVEAEGQEIVERVAYRLLELV